MKSRRRLLLRFGPGGGTGPVDPTGALRDSANAIIRDHANVALTDHTGA